MWLINNEILFNPESRTLENKGKVTLQLNASASRCLSLFMHNPGDVISREALLREGWGNQGVLVTDNSLRQVLSTLRKQFSHFNIEGDLFVTMHRKGYRLNEDIIVKSLIPVIEPHDEKPLGVLDANKLSNVKAKSYWHLFKRRKPGSHSAIRHVLFTCIGVISSGIVLLIFSLMGIKIFDVKGVVDIRYQEYRVENSLHWYIQQDLTKAHMDKIEHSLPVIKKEILHLISLEDNENHIYIHSDKMIDRFSWFICQRPIEKENALCRSVMSYVAE